MLNNVDYWLTKLRGHLTAGQLSPWTIRGYVNDGRRFLRYLNGRGVSLRKAVPGDEVAFLDFLRRNYKQRVGCLPPNDIRWRCEFTPSMHALLRLAQGQWPPVSNIERRLNWFRAKLAADNLTPATLRHYLSAVRAFLGFLEPHEIEPEHVNAQQMDEFVRTMRKAYRQKHGRHPRSHSEWKRRHLTGIQRFLTLIQGQWPPPSVPDPELAAYREHLAKRGVIDKTRNEYCLHVHLFLDYTRAKQIDISSITVEDLKRFFQVALNLYRSRQRHGPPATPSYFRKLSHRSIHGFLRFRRGPWPPAQPLVERFRAYLEDLQYWPQGIADDVGVVRRFLAYLGQRETIRKADVDNFVEVQRGCYRKRHGREPQDLIGWRSQFTAPIRSLFRMLSLPWQVEPVPATPWARLTQKLCDGYCQWITEVRGLSIETFRKNGATAKDWLVWLGERSESPSLHRVNVDDIDQFLAWRLPSLRRATRLGVCSGLRSFLRYLHAAKHLRRDLSALVTQPSHYQFEEIPRSYTQEQVDAVLACARKNRSVAGLRDYTMLLLLATYGMRSGEVRKLKLSDIDWRGERLNVRHSKTGVESSLPLVEPVAEAILDYLQHGRPKTSLREVFLRIHAPFRPMAGPGSLASVVRRRLQEAGIEPAGRRGTHAFRFARAISMMRASVPLKWIGDLLGHRRADSTQTYVRLAMDDLRELSLDVPGYKPEGQP